MPISPQAMTTETEESLQLFDAVERDALRRDWLTLVDLAVWGGAQSQQIGALPRMRAAAEHWARQLEALNVAPPED